MAIQKNPAIVLKTMPFRSSSLIVTFFTRDFGKIRGLAKGVRLERELRGAQFELFTELDLVYYEKTRSDLHLISEASIIENYDPMHGRLEGLAYASYFAELVDTLTEIQDPHPKIYELLDFAFKYLASLPGQRLARLFEVKLLNEIGWLPYLDRCLGCEAPNLEEGFFSPRQGALLCPKCAAGHPDVMTLSREPLAIMRYYIGHDLDMSLRLGVTKAAEVQLASLLDRFFIERLNRPFKSRLFLEKIKPALV